jgi:hypothetical protein
MEDGDGSSVFQNADLSRYRLLMRRFLKTKETAIATVTSERIQKDQAQDFIQWMTMGPSHFTLTHTFGTLRHHGFAPGRRTE